MQELSKGQQQYLQSTITCSDTQMNTFHLGKKIRDTHIIHFVRNISSCYSSGIQKHKQTVCDLKEEFLKSPRNNRDLRGDTLSMLILGHEKKSEV